MAKVAKVMILDVRETHLVDHTQVLVLCQEDTSWAQRRPGAWVSLSRGEGGPELSPFFEGCHRVAPRENGQNG